MPAIIFDWAGGLIWLATDDVSGDAGAGLIRGALSEAGGGHATLIRAPGDVRRSAAPFHPQPVLLQGLSARVKASFDPRNVLNAHRMYAAF